MKIAIDGPAGAGKSTVAKELARRLGFIYIDTGAMYRALTWKALEKGIGFEDSKALHELAKTTDIHFKYNSDNQKIICDSEDITGYIRSPQVSREVSRVASCSLVRDIMVRRQQEMAKTISVVMDGRDIGECVLPDAEYKFYLTANIDERVKRRIRDLKNQGYNVDFESIKKDIIERDINDSARDIGALKILKDSIVIDTGNLTVDQVLNMILNVIQGD